MKHPNYRQGIGAVVLNAHDEVLVCQRRGNEQHFQFPQGGVHNGEKKKAALLRELEEEIGTNKVEILTKLPEITRYLWPDRLRQQFDGQEHSWYVVRLKEGQVLQASKEFTAFRWLPADQVMKNVAEVRRPIYEHVFEMIRATDLPVAKTLPATAKTPGQLFEDLVAIMRRLRDPKNGCPWDLKQSHQSIRPYLIEEAYEVVESIDNNDMAALKEELGDLLLQVVFHSQLEAETGVFSIHDVICSINDKMIRRHPHIFGTVEAKDAETVLRNWEEIKKGEKKTNGDKRESLLDGIPVHLPALLKARRVQERAKSVGFDWDTVDPAMDKVREEVEEFAHVCQDGQADRMEDEMGDLLFALVNVARFMNIDPEKALERTIKKFSHRFRYIEQKFSEQNRGMSQGTLAEMDLYWEEAKNLKS